MKTEKPFKIIMPSDLVEKQVRALILSHILFSENQHRSTQLQAGDIKYIVKQIYQDDNGWNVNGYYSIKTDIA